MSFIKKFTIREWLVLAAVFAILAAMVSPKFFHDIDNSKPIASYLKPSEFSAEKRSQIVFKSLRQIDKSGTEITCVLLNNGVSPIYYYGYTPDSFSPRSPAGQISPFYAIHVKSGDQWEPIPPMGRCGTGAGQMRLLPGEAGQFAAYLQRVKGKEIKIGLSTSADAAGRIAGDGMIWSSSIALAD
jgi:hypothetical protein